MIEVDEQTKIRLAKFGANKLFIKDYDDRQKMTSEELIELFEKTWSRVLKRQLQIAETIEVGEVNRRLLDKQQEFVDSTQTHRSFRHAKAEFIAQLEELGDSRYRLTQLWRVASSDNHPKTLFVNFGSAEQRDRFAKLANSLDTNDDELGLELIRNFMNLHPGYQYDELS